MTRRENFVGRWLRLKRATEKQHKAGTTVNSAPEADAPPSPRFDPADLPPIESISAATDIRAFLRAGVPAALTRAALRRAWLSDPTIRDFIGIAENQWDFTDPTAIPGFGPLLATDDLPRLVAQATGTLDKVPAVVADAEVAAEDAAISTPARETDNGQGAGKNDRTPPQ
jgi:hypothetical protein